MRFGIDLDGTIFKVIGKSYYTPTEMGGVPFLCCLNVLNALLDKGHKIYIYFCRLNPTIDGNKPYTLVQLRKFVVGHLEEHKVPYTSISCYKPVCDYYLDDRNLLFSTGENFELMLQEGGLI